MQTPEFHIVLYEPVIPQNTGSIARLCACTGATLHLIHPLGFQVDEAAVKRAGLDYWPYVKIHEHANWQAFLDSQKPQSIYFFTKFAKKSLWEMDCKSPDQKAIYLVFGSEAKGLPQALRDENAKYLIKVPMRTDLVRSLNLSQCCALVLYEGLRQTGFSAGTEPST